MRTARTRCPPWIHSSRTAWRAIKSQHSYDRSASIYHTHTPLEQHPLPTAQQHITALPVPAATTLRTLSVDNDVPTFLVIFNKPPGLVPRKRFFFLHGTAAYSADRSTLAPPAERSSCKRVRIARGHVIGRHHGARANARRTLLPFLVRTGVPIIGEFE